MKLVEVSVGQFVVARYEGNQNYLGKASAIDESDDTAHINFMTQSGKCERRFRWPNKEDKLWIDKEDITKHSDDLRPTAKTGRIFSVDEDVLKLLED